MPEGRGLIPGQREALALMTKVPGIAAKRVVITDECRKLHGDGGAFNTAALALLSMYNDITHRRGDEKGLNYHLMLTVEDMKGCTCRSYHERTGKHAEACPLSKPPAKRPTEVLKKPRGGHMASMPEPRQTLPVTPHSKTLPPDDPKSSKTPTEVLPAVKDPAPHLTQAQKDAGCDGK